ncbi:GNAT family N-acetyltransferase [Moritella sp. 28]|uniref:GNAT family N-acetyltransferase n=1 Tax=Moritella sp. 28 TaxID=2746232 RepID=UPI001BA7FAF9|nr:GNAT family N-acetyltransferase [Moritella sp. 28]QUM86226.1 GNAT family N-acetyltransferase [Moritella sp. 28]
MQITTQRLSMCQITEQDWPLFLRLHTESRVIEKCFDQPSDDDIRVKFESRLPNWSVTSGAWLCLVITDVETNTAVGITGFDYDGRSAEVGYLLLPEYFGLGYATESLLGVIAWAMRVHLISVFQGIVTEGNVVSEKVLAKCGFKLDEVIPQAYSIGGVLYADWIYKLNTSSQA